MPRLLGTPVPDAAQPFDGIKLLGILQDTAWGHADPIHGSSSLPGC
jgi:hypothetical protein